MLQVSEKIIVLNPGDQLPQITNNSVKIYLAGTQDFSNAENDWQQKFINGLVPLTDPLKGLLMFKSTNFIIFNPHVPFESPAAPNLDNPQFIQVMQWRMSMMDQADMVFLNLLNKSKSPVPVLEFGLLANTNKLVVRCGEEYMLYSQIRLYCEKYNIPLLTGKTSVKDVMLAGGNYIQKVTDASGNPQTQLPE